MKKIRFEINNWSYNIQAEDNFAKYLVRAMKEDFIRPSADGRKTILLAYIKAKYQLYEQDKKIKGKML